MYDFTSMSADELDNFLNTAIKQNNKEAVFEARSFLNLKYLTESNNQSKCKLSVEVIAIKCCPECDKYDGFINDIEKEIKTPSLPRKECTRFKTGCICCYAPKIVFDNNDIPVMKDGFNYGTL